MLCRKHPAHCNSKNTAPPPCSHLPRGVTLSPRQTMAPLSGHAQNCPKGLQVSGFEANRETAEREGMVGAWWGSRPGCLRGHLGSWEEIGHCHQARSQLCQVLAV